MVNKDKWCPNTTPLNKKIMGENFKYVKLNAKARDDILEAHIDVSEEGMSTNTELKMMREMLAALIVEVPTSLKKEFELKNGKPWKGTPDDIGRLDAPVEDALHDAFQEQLGSLSGDKKDFCSSPSGPEKAATQ